MSPTAYLRYPDLHGDLLAFVAEDDVWMAPVTGGRAWRVSAMALPARSPKFSPDGASLAWQVIQGGAPEIVTADADGGNFRQLTFWGSQSTRMKGFNSAGQVIATSSVEQEDSRLRWAFAVPLDGSAPVKLPYGPVETLAEGPAVGDERPMVIGSMLTREQAWWKRYRGGTAGKLWIDADGNGEFERLVPELDGNLSDPMWIDGRVVFLSDHEGYGNLYSVTPQGTDLRRHTDFDGFYVRHASSDGSRIVFESAGRLWILPSLDAEAQPLDIVLGSAGTARRPRPLDVARHLSAAVPAAGGDASIVETHGTLHWLTHRDGPSRVIVADSAARARLGRPLGTSHAVFVADFQGEEAIYIKDVFAGTAPVAAPESHPVEKLPAPKAAGEGDPVPGLILPSPVSASGAAVRIPQQTVPQVPEQHVETDADGQNSEPAGRPGDDAAPANAGSVTVRVGFDTPTRVSQLVPSPDGKRVGVSTEYGEVFVLDVGTEQLFPVASSGFGAVDQLAFSPDSQWLAWSEPASAEGRTKIRLRSVLDMSAPVIDVTDGRFSDHDPSFTTDGRYLAFLSERSFDPVYDTHRFDLSFPSSTKPFLVALAADTPSPFGPSVSGVPAQRAGDARKDAGSGAEDKSVVEAQAVQVDAERIGDRIIAVPVPQGRYDKLQAARDALLWQATDIYGVTGDGRASATDREPASRLERFDLATKEVSVLAGALDSFAVSSDGTKVVLRHEGGVRVVPTAAKVEEDSADSIRVDLDRIRVRLDPVKVWGQAFDEAWRLQRDFFWAPDMGGLDWEGVHSRYRPLVQNLGSHDDLVDLLWEMHGELGTSHAYVSPAPVTEQGSGSQGFLGADLRPGPGGWEVVRILGAESSDPQATSPLSAPGADVHPGDFITAVDGQPVPASEGPAPLLAGAAGRAVELTILSTDDGGAPVQRRIAVVPLRSEERLRYQNWVHANRRIVREASGGMFGYLHIPDMVANGWSQLHRDLDQEASLQALVVDVRRNRGGHTSQLVAELIGRKVTAWANARGGKPTPYPAHAPRGPVVILTDEFAGSDGDIITQVAKLRSIGPVVGTRTWGGVVGIDGRFDLMDGTVVNQPRFAYWFTGGVGWDVENRGVEPDIEVAFPPHAYAAGEDPQLEHGVGILREMLSELPTDEPPAMSGYRGLQPAPLPPRPQASNAGDQSEGRAGEKTMALPEPVRVGTGETGNRDNRH
ncbi:S41 family peptidase [Arthrobacter citreus]|uniref:S41 family peptidase n=1 Tax=Arthrobacter TaxID=1663 RepID=UPI0012657A46|nr:S41 family peptidase [Arthrobacter gandavensis]